MASPPVDAAEHEQLLQELVNCYRYAALGRRLRGIIHSLNSSLQVLLMQSELLERKLSEEQDAFAPALPPAMLSQWQTLFDYRRKKNRQLHDVSTDMQQLVHWLKRRTAPENNSGSREIDLNELLREELEGYQSDQFLQHQVAKRFQWHEGLPPINGSSVDISQCFGNLLDNALEALREVPEPVLSITTALASGRPLIVVADNGPGIPEENLEKIFQPFFTTKSTPEKPRSGLGLFLTRRLLRPYGGEVRVQSQPGQTCFSVVFA
jgi:signal transduction histidine kinase